MSSLCLFYMPESGPCRTVLLVSRYLGLRMKLKHVDLVKGDNRTADFLKMNPQHNIPVLKDGNFILSESRAIITYLAEKYTKNQTFYPEELQSRALVHQRLFFDMGTLYSSIIKYYAVAYFGATKFDESNYAKIEEAFQYLDKFLEGNNFVTGNNLTVADLALVSSVATAISVFDFEVQKYGNVNRWLSELSTILPGYEELIVKNGMKLRKLVHGYFVKNIKNK